MADDKFDQAFDKVFDDDQATDNQKSEKTDTSKKEIYKKVDNKVDTGSKKDPGQPVPKPALPSMGKAGKKDKSEELELKPALKKNLASSAHPGSGMKAKLFAFVMIFVGLLVGFLAVSFLLPGTETDDGGETTPTPTQEASPSATPTVAEVIDPTVPDIEILSVEELGFDRDGDALPDKLEEILDYDPDGNDCVRQLGCGDFPTVPRAKLEINLIFLLDASGSMTEKLEGVSKWDLAKDALIELLDAGLPRFANVALIVYGHQGDASVGNRVESCNGVEVVEPLSGVDVELFKDTVDEIEPKGWTPLAKALEEGGDILLGKDFAQNFIIMLSDGKETCDGDPAAVAKQLHDSGVEVITNVVGLTVKDDERDQLEMIAQSGGGRYFGADTPDELRQALLLSAEAIRLWDEVNQCILDNLQVYGQCINVQYLKSLNYMEEMRLELEAQTGSYAGGGFIPLEYNQTIVRIRDRYKQLRDENWEQYDEDLRKLYPE